MRGGPLLLQAPAEPAQQPRSLPARHSGPLLAHARPVTCSAPELLPPPPTPRPAPHTCRELAPTLDISLPVSMMSLLEGLLAQLPAAAPPQPPSTELLQGIFTFALVWSIDGSTDSAGRAAFDGFLCKLLTQEVRAQGARRLHLCHNASLHQSHARLAESTRPVAAPPDRCKRTRSAATTTLAPAW
jgi:hypothetical protein